MRAGESIEVSFVLKKFELEADGTVKVDLFVTVLPDQQLYLETAVQFR